MSGIKAIGKSRRKSGEDYNRKFKRNRTIKSNRPTTSSANSIFRTDILNKSLAIKSGFLFSNILKGDEAWMFAEQWLKCLKSHHLYEPLFIEKQSTIQELFSVLRNETNRIFKNYEWCFRKDGNTEEFTLIYFRSLGDVGLHTIPLDWFDKQKNTFIKLAGLYLLKKISDAFGIDLVINGIMDMVLESSNYEVIDLIEHLKETWGYDSDEDEVELFQAVADLKSYSSGKPRQLLRFLNDVALLGNEKEFEYNLNQTSIFNKDIYEWLCDGKWLLEGNCVNVHSFNLNPYDFDKQDGDLFGITESIFFPYSFDDLVYAQYENWTNDTQNCLGTNDMWQYGMLTDKKHIQPPSKKPLIDLINWLDKGRTIYFKQKQNGI